MSAAAAALPVVTPAPSIWTAVAGTDLPLPPGVRRDLAYVWDDELGDGDSLSAFTYTTSGDFVEVPLFMSAVLTTSAAGGVREAAVVFHTVGAAPTITAAAVATQGASLSYLYTWTIGTAAGYGPVGNTVATPLLPVLLTGGDFFTVLTISGTQAGDQWTASFVRTIRVPSGPALELAAAPATAVPLLT
jgi:hypothetical protein